MKSVNLHIGLFDESGKELKGKGYKRVSIEGISLKLKKDTFCNESNISFPKATGAWKRIGYFGLFSFKNAKIPISHHVIPVRGALRKGDRICIMSGELKFQWY